MQYSKDMLICDIVDSHPQAKDVLLEFGLPCSECIVAYSETLSQGVKPHDLEPEPILDKLNALVAKGKPKK